jgi:hypothetical protein
MKIEIRYYDSMLCARIRKGRSLSIDHLGDLRDSSRAFTTLVEINQNHRANTLHVNRYQGCVLDGKDTTTKYPFARAEPWRGSKEA